MTFVWNGLAGIVKYSYGAGRFKTETAHGIAVDEEVRFGETDMKIFPEKFPFNIDLKTIREITLRQETSCHIKRWPTS